MKKSAKIYAVLIALALLFTAGCVRKTADSDNVESSNELPSFISETTTTANDEVSTEKETGTTGENEPEEQTTDTVVIPETPPQTTPQTTPARENVATMPQSRRRRLPHRLRLKDRRMFLQPSLLRMIHQHILPIVVPIITPN